MGHDSKFTSVLLLGILDDKMLPFAKALHDKGYDVYLADTTLHDYPFWKILPFIKGSFCLQHSPGDSFEHSLAELLDILKMIPDSKVVPMTSLYLSFVSLCFDELTDYCTLPFPSSDALMGVLDRLAVCNDSTTCYRLTSFEDIDRYVKDVEFPCSLIPRFLYIKQGRRLIRTTPKYITTQNSLVDWCRFYIGSNELFICSDEAFFLKANVLDEVRQLWPTRLKRIFSEIQKPISASSWIIYGLKSPFSLVIAWYRYGLLMLSHFWQSWAKLRAYFIVFFTQRFLKQKTLQRLRDGEDIVFICRGNIFRSPFAASFFNTHFSDYKGRVFSSGTYPIVSRRVGRKALYQGQELNVDMSDHLSTYIGDLDSELSLSSIYFVLDLRQYVMVKELCPSAFVVPLGLWSDSLSFSFPDPYGYSASYLKDVYERIGHSITKMMVL